MAKWRTLYDALYVEIKMLEVQVAYILIPWPIMDPLGER